CSMSGASAGRNPGGLTITHCPTESSAEKASPLPARTNRARTPTSPRRAATVKDVEHRNTKHLRLASYDAEGSGQAEDVNEPGYFSSCGYYATSEEPVAGRRHCHRRHRGQTRPPLL